jgi:regulatory protein
VELRVEECYQSAMHLLNYRWRGTAELRQRLLRRNYDEKEIAETLQRLEREGWLDDDRFARELARSRATRHGRRRIEADLRRHGVEEEVVRRALDSALDPDTEEALLRRTAGKRIEILSERYGNDYPSTEVGRRKLARFLLSRGHPLGDVMRVLDELTAGGEQAGHAGLMGSETDR